MLVYIPIRRTHEHHEREGSLGLVARVRCLYIYRAVDIYPATAILCLSYERPLMDYDENP